LSEDGDLRQPLGAAVKIDVTATLLGLGVLGTRSRNHRGVVANAVQPFVVRKPLVIRGYTSQQDQYIRPRKHLFQRHRFRPLASR